MNILLVDDDAACWDGPLDSLLKRNEQTSHAELEIAESGNQALEMIKERSFGLVLMDGHLMEEYGHEIVRKIRTAGYAMPICMFSSDDAQATLGKEAGAEFSVNKRQLFDRSAPDLAFEQENALAAIIILCTIRG